MVLLNTIFNTRLVAFYFTLVWISWNVFGYSQQEQDSNIRYYEYQQPSIRLLPSYKHLESKHQTPINNNNKTLLNFKKITIDSRMLIELKGFNTSFTVYLEPTKDLFHPKAEFVHKGEDLIHLDKGNLKLDDYWLFNGFVLNNEVNNKEELIDKLEVGVQLDPNEYNLGWASIMLHPIKYDDNNNLVEYSLQGVFKINSIVFHLDPIHHFNLYRRNEDPKIPESNQRNYKYKNSNTILYKLNDSSNLNKKREPLQCGTNNNYDLSETNNQLKDPYLKRLVKNHLMRRADGSKFGCDMKKRILYMGVAADCNYISHYKSADAARKKIIQDWNTVSLLYERNFGVKLGIIKIETMSDKCPDSPQSDAIWNRKCDKEYNMQERLNDFSAWREKKGQDQTGLWHLVTDCKSGANVGLAYVGTICASSRAERSRSINGDVGTGVSSITEASWKVIAHEIGHNFGAIHDCTSSTCGCSAGNCEKCCPCGQSCDCGGKYLMNPESSQSGDDFSACSMEAICGTISKVGSCLNSSGSIPTYSEAMCGNGIVEKGEECDCGGEAGCQNNNCCDPKSCKFKGNAVCDDQNDLCCSKCQVKPKGVTCRPKTGFCDVEEVCDGKSGQCPKDSFLDNGTSCELPNVSSGDLRCANGICTSRNLQCEARSKGFNVQMTSACDNFNSEPCRLRCAAPGNAFACYTLSGDFADGTKCGVNQYCDNGECKGGSFFDSIATWFVNNKIYGILIGVAVGLILLSIICSCCCRARRAKPFTHQPRSSVASSYPLNGLAPNNNHNQHFVDPIIYNGPTPPYSNFNGNHHNSNQFTTDGYYPQPPPPVSQQQPYPLGGR